jgi:hypothetical protein
MTMKKAINYCKTYIQEINKLWTGKNEEFHFLDAVRFFPGWLFSINGKSSAIKDERPWLTFSALRFLEKILNSNMQVFEYGSGGSTLYFAKRCRHLISVEHDQEWACKVSDAMKKKRYENWTYHVIKPAESEVSARCDPANPRSYASASSKYQHLSFKDYVRAVDDYPDGYFDIILIDGRARPSCLYHSVNKVKRGGYLILDNAERPHYAFIHKALGNYHWKGFNFYGPGPYIDYFWQTYIWQKVDDYKETENIWTGKENEPS